jgi:mono/diheme cytochrome c family protein
MRPLVVGTIAREDDVRDGAVRTGLDEGRYVPKVPVPLTAELLRLGRTHFEITCAACHGLRGDGRSVVASKMSLRPPPSLVDAPIAQEAPGRIYSVITLGYGLMPSYAPQLSVEDRWAIVAYWQALVFSQDAPLELAPPEVRERLSGSQP